MSKRGHVRLKRWYEPGADRDDYYDLTDIEVYYDLINKQYKVKFDCDECGIFLGWYCYDTNNIHALLYEIGVGMLCTECYKKENNDIDYEDCELFDGRLCTC